ncbi:MAG: patatin-like phospholipase family protein [Hormoscilla sp. GM7CHS1pb]|nr:patatin-like phospholipase family protein [Hormoscilla sp. GM7CHS1pb]
MANSWEDPSLTPLEGQVREWQNQATSVKRTLVLIHPDNGKLPSQTHRWLQPRILEMHHHIRWHRQEDIERVARFLADRAVGLALGGGVARGSAHIGVLQALEKTGIPVDFIGGTSTGGGIAAQYAMGWNLNTT